MQNAELMDEGLRLFLLPRSRGHIGMGTEMDSGKEPLLGPSVLYVVPACVDNVYR